MEAKSSYPAGSAAAGSPYRSRPLRHPAPPTGEYVVQVCGAADMAAEVDAWRELAQRAVEPNIFAEPDFVLPAIQHLSDCRGITFLVVRQGARVPSGSILRAVFPLVLPRFALTPSPVALWRPPFAPYALPLIERTDPEEILHAALTSLAGLGYGDLLVSPAPTEGAFAALLRDATVRMGRRLIVSDGLRGPVGTAIRSMPLTATNNVKNAPGAGETRIERARTPRQVRDAVEEFLLLEASDPSRRGPALIEDTGTATFVRTMSRQFARQGQCRVHIVRIDGELAAAALVLQSGKQAWLWGLASDNASAGQRAAERLLADLARSRSTRSGEASVASVSEHPLPDKLWRDRIAAADHAVALRAPRPPLTAIGGRIHRHVQAVRRQVYSRFRAVAKGAQAS
jgi:hypothetical protein